MINSRKSRLLYWAVSLVAVGSACHGKPTLSHEPLSDERAAVYHAFLGKFSFLHVTNLATVTVPFDFKGFPENRPCLQGMELENVSGAMRTAHTFGSDFVRGTDMKLVNPLDQAKLFEGKKPISNAQREDATKDLDSKLSFHVLSEIVFDTRHHFAVLKHLVICGQKCVSGETLVMERVSDKWVVSSRRPCAMFIGN